MLLRLYAAVILGPGAVLLVLGPGEDLTKLKHREETICIWLTAFFYLWLGALIFWIFGILGSAKVLWILLTLGLPLVYLAFSFLFRRIQRRRVRQFQSATLSEDPAEAAKVSITIILRSGYFSLSCSAAKRALLNVVLRPLEKPM